MANAMPKIPDHVVSREVGEETVILSLESGNYFGLNAVGGAIWKGLATGQSRDEILAAVLAEFDAPAEVIASDYDALIRQLTDRGLIVTGEDEREQAKA